MVFRFWNQDLGKGFGTKDLGAGSWLNWPSIALATVPFMKMFCLLLLFNNGDSLFVPGEKVGEGGR